MSLSRFLGALFVVFLLGTEFAQGQTLGFNTCDTILIRSETFIVLNDSVIFVKHDSLIELCSDAKLLTYEDGKDFYDKLRGGVEKSSFLLGIYNALVSTPTIDTSLSPVRVYKAEEKFLPFEGAAIRNIRIKRLSPFGTDISDTSVVSSNSANKALNRTHIKTQEWVIRKNLLFKESDTVSSLLMAENMRLLSLLPYIEDASISVMEAEADSVDILVITRDKFPFAGFPIIRSIDNISIYGWTENFLGMGHKLRGGATYHSKTIPNLYIAQVNYAINNITHFIDGEINYEVGEKSQLYSLYLKRELIPSYVRWAGEFWISDKLENVPYDPSLRDGIEYTFRYRDFDMWSSYLFNATKSVNPLKQTYIIPGLRYAERVYNQRPYIAMDSSSRFINTTYFMANIVLARQNYDITNYLLDFGKIEYIPYGFQIRINGGYSWTEYYSKPYLGIGFDMRIHLKQFGYLTLLTDVGSHFGAKGPFQGAVDAEAQLLSRLISQKSHQIRLYTALNYTAGINRTTDDLLYLDDQHGIYGLTGKAYAGNKRLSYRAGLIDFTPWRLLGFNFAAFAAFDGGWITSSSVNLFETNMVAAISAGVYVKNNFLVFDAFQLRATYFPVTPEGVSNFGIELSLLPLFPQLNFLFTRPEKVIFD